MATITPSIISAISEVLRASAFTPCGPRIWRRVSSETVHLFELQLSKWEGGIYLNIGVSKAQQTLPKKTNQCQMYGRVIDVVDDDFIAKELEKLEQSYDSEHLLGLLSNCIHDKIIKFVEQTNTTSKLTSANGKFPALAFRVE